MGVGKKTEDKMIKFNYEGETYYGKVYIINLYVSVFLGVLVLNLLPKFLGALIKKEEIKEISMLSGSFNENVAYFIGLLVGIMSVYLLEKVIWKIIRGDRKIDILKKNRYVKNNYVPMTMFQIRAGLYITLFTLVFMWLVVFVLTECTFAMAAFEVTGMYLADVCITCHIMKKYKCEYYIPLDFAGGVVGVKNEKAITYTLYNKNMDYRNLQNNYYV